MPLLRGLSRARSGGASLVAGGAAMPRWSMLRGGVVASGRWAYGGGLARGAVLGRPRGVAAPLGLRSVVTASPVLRAEDGGASGGRKPPRVLGAETESEAEELLGEEGVREIER